MSNPAQVRYAASVVLFALVGVAGSFVPHGWGLPLVLCAALGAVVGAWALRAPLDPQRALWGVLALLAVCAPLLCVPVALIALPVVATGALDRWSA